MPGTLYLVATPIGNLEDITYRAVRLLKECSVIACEDTRQTGKLLAHFAIDTPKISLHEHNETQRSSDLVARLAAGENLALVSDAGTPLVSDPGYRLVRQAIESGVDVVPVPGPSAVLAALVSSGLATDSFVFCGFLSPKGGTRRTQLAERADETATVIFFEAPHRILDTLGDVAELLPGRPVVVAREVTKKFEEFLRGTAEEIATTLRGRPAVQGEMVLLFGKALKAEPQVAAAEVLRAEVESLIGNGVDRKDAIKQVARQRGLPKAQVYRYFAEGSGS